MTRYARLTEQERCEIASIIEQQIGEIEDEELGEQMQRLADKIATKRK